MKTGRDLLEHELRDMYDAEKQLLSALDDMASKVNDQKLSEGFETHRDQTQRHVERIEQCFEALGSTPKREPCVGIKGLIGEFEEFVAKENPAPQVLDVFATGAALKVEHYEVAAYKSLIKLAFQSGLDDVVSPLEQNLNDELETARELENMAIQLGDSLALKG
jgi:ferritin-like metal-binding protein YciE